MRARPRYREARSARELPVGAGRRGRRRADRRAARRLLGPDLERGPRRVRGGPGHRSGGGRLGARSVLLGIRFRPGAGGAALGLPLSELRDRRVDLAELRPELAARLHAGLEPPTPRTRCRGSRGAGRTPADAAVERRGEAGRPAARVEALAGELGLSERQLRRRFHAARATAPRRSSACCASAASSPVARGSRPGGARGRLRGPGAPPREAHGWRARRPARLIRG